MGAGAGRAPQPASPRLIDRVDYAAEPGLPGLPSLLIGAPIVIALRHGLGLGEILGVTASRRGRGIRATAKRLKLRRIRRIARHAERSPASGASRMHGDDVVRGRVHDMVDEARERLERARLLVGVGVAVIDAFDARDGLAERALGVSRHTSVARQQ